MRSLAIALVLVVAAVSTNAGTYEVTAPSEWWHNTTVHEVWVPSFKDSDGSGKGDLRGITSKLEHFVDMGIGTVWLTPFYATPMTDSGYDISNYREVYSEYGDLDDFADLITEAHACGLKVIIDFVPNHVSDQHEWYLAALNGTYPYVDYFIWNNGTLSENGTRVPPNNWIDMFNGGSTWLWVQERNAFVYHQFNTHQIDLNYRNPLVMDEILDVMTFWLDQDIDGFRVDAVPFLVEDPDFTDETFNDLGYSWPNYYCMNHSSTMDQQESYEILKKMKEHVENYTQAANDSRVRPLFTEGYQDIDYVMKWYDYGVDCPFNFFFIHDGQIAYEPKIETASDIVSIVDTYMTNLPTGRVANWVFGNHDMNRVADRFGKKLVDAINCLVYILPGIATVYNGDEIGINGTYLTWAETTDVRACSTSESEYEDYSRDPMRTPYQWDNTTSAGFSTNSTPYLKVSSDYLTVNLAAQKEADVSHYKNVQAAIKLRSTKVVTEGNLIIKTLADVVVAFARTLDGCDPIAVFINWSNATDANVCMTDLLTDTKYTLFEVLIADVYSGIAVGDQFNSSSLVLPPNAAVVLQGIK